MNTQTLASEESADSKPTQVAIPSGLENRLRPIAPLVFTEAKKSGIITTRELAAVIRGECVSDRYVFKSTISIIGQFLAGLGINLAKGKIDLERRTIPLPKTVYAVALSLKFNKLTDADFRAVQSLADRNVDFDDSELALYQEVCIRFPLLKAVEQTELFKARAQGDLEAHFRLILHNLKLVFHWADKRRNRGLDFEDLVQEGILGLMIAVGKFDWQRGYLFSTYGSWWIRSKIDRAIDDKARSIRIPVHLAEKFYMIKRASSQLLATLGREPTNEEIAERLKMSPRYVKKMLEAVYGTETSSLDQAPREMADNETADLYRAIPDQQAVSPVSLLEAKEALEDVASEVRALLVRLQTLPCFDDRFRKIFRMRYGLDGLFFSRPTLEAIGEQFGVTRERIRQIVAAVWERLKREGVSGGDEWLLAKLSQIEELESVTNSFVKI